jgi:hypothetical protein
MPGIQKDSGLAIASLITGIVAWLMVPLLGALAAIITGHLAKKEIRESNGTITGSGMATAGLILGYIQLCFMVIALIALIIFLVTTPHLFDGFRNTNLRF